MFMGFGFILTVVFVIGIIYLLNNQGQGRNNLFTGPVRNDKSALSIAEERYARGEIDKEEFEQLRYDLTS